MNLVKQVFLLGLMVVSCVAQIITNPDWTMEAIERHNLFRKGYDAPPLLLNEELCVVSQNMADSLAKDTAHLVIRTEDRDVIADGVSVFVAPTGGHLVYGSTAVDYWYSAVADYDFTSHTGFTDRDFTAFSQIVWKSTREICVSYGTYDIYNTTDVLVIVVAVYDPPANTEKFFKDNIIPLQTSPFFFREVLMAPPPEHLSDPILTSKPGRRRRTIQPFPPFYFHRNYATDINIMNYGGFRFYYDQLCPTHERETQTDTPPEWIIAALGQINFYRYRHGAHILQLNRELCEIAQSAVNDMAKKDKSIEAHTGCGESVYVSQKEKVDPHEPVNAWYNKADENYNFAHFRSNIEDKYEEGKVPVPGGTLEHFTQMVWEGTEEACVVKATTASKSRTYVLALYYPPGNIPEMYQENVRVNRSWIEEYDQVVITCAMYQELDWILTTALITVFLMVVF